MVANTHRRKWTAKASKKINEFGWSANATVAEQGWSLLLVVLVRDMRGEDWLSLKRPAVCEVRESVSKTWRPRAATSHQPTSLHAHSRSFFYFARRRAFILGVFFLVHSRGCTQCAPSWGIAFLFPPSFIYAVGEKKAIAPLLPSPRLYKIIQSTQRLAALRWDDHITKVLPTKKKTNTHHHSFLPASFLRGTKITTASYHPTRPPQST
jgi:hypothetical protein